MTIPQLGDPGRPARKGVSNRLEADASGEAGRSQVCANGHWLRADEMAVDLAGDVALQAPDDLARGRSLGRAALGVRGRRRVSRGGPHPRGGPQCVEGMEVPRTVERVANGL